MPLSVSRRTGALLASAVLVPALIATGINATASPAAPGGDEAVVQYQVQAKPGANGTDLAAQLMADGYDVYGGDGDGTVFVHAPASAGAALEARGDLTVLAENTVVIDWDAPAPASLDAVLPERLKGQAYDTYYGGYRTHAAFDEFMDDLETEYPSLAKVVKYGETWTGANDLQAVCFTAGADKAGACELDPDSDKARFLLIGQIHARELSTGEVSWRMMSLLTDQYGKDASITQLLDDTEFWIVPQVNPDGIETHEVGITEEGTGGLSDAWQRKNLNDDGGACSGGASSQIGIDLNRNFDAAWGGAGTSPVPCNLTFRGPSAASEPETVAMQDLILDLFEDQRGSGAADPAPADTVGAMISMHSYSNLVLFPYGDVRTTPNDAGLRSFAFRMSDYSGYRTGQPDEILYQVTGSTDDFSYEKQGIASFTYEIGPSSGACSGFFPAFSCQPDFWELNRDAILYAATATQQPYTMTLGPTTSGAKAKAKGKKVVVTATSDDDAYGTNGVGRPQSQNVTEGRIYLGDAPWQGGEAKAMKVKGSGKAVTLQAKVKPGKKKAYAYIQGKDSQGNWGPVEMVWIPKK